MKSEYQKKDKNLEYKACKVSIKASDEKGLVEAYVSIFGNVDSYDEVIERGAFRESLEKKLPKGVWAHNWDKPIAKTIEAEEDEKGLRIKGKLVLEVQQAKEAYALLKEGVIDEFSIGYSVLKDEVNRETGIRTLKKLRLYEWSPVLVGANPDTEVIGVKNAEKKEKKEVKEVKEIKEEDAKKDESKVLSIENKELVKDIISQLKELSSSLAKLVEAQKEPTPIAGGEKVEPKPENFKRILKVKGAAKEIDKNAEYILRLVKNK